MKKSNRKCDTREIVAKKYLTKSEKWEACGTGRRDSEKWDFLSASLLQVPLLQSLLAMHEWVNQACLISISCTRSTIAHFRAPLPPAAPPPPSFSLTSSASPVFHHPFIANKHTHTLAFSKLWSLIPWPHFYCLFSTWMCDRVGIPLALSPWQTLRLILAGRHGHSDREKVDLEQRWDRRS